MNMKQIVGGKMYNTETATLLASDHYWDGHNFQRDGINQYLYKTAKGNYFVLRTTVFQGQVDTIVPSSKGEAMELYESLREQEVDYAEAFDIEPEEA
jgi:hypothetical protein